MATSTLTSKGQTTVPSEVRRRLGLSPGDAIDWEIAGGRAEVRAAQKAYLRLVGAIRVGKGSIRRDIEEARKRRGLRPL